GAAAALWPTAGERRPHGVMLVSLCAGVLAACLARTWDDPGRWLSFHVLTACWGAVGVAAIVARSLAPAAWRDRGSPEGVQRWLAALAAALLGLALRGGWADPARPWVGAGAALVAFALMMSLKILYRRGSHAYASGLCLAVAGALLWLAWGPNT